MALDRKAEWQQGDPALVHFGRFYEIFHLGVAVRGIVSEAICHLRHSRRSYGHWSCVPDESQPSQLQPVKQHHIQSIKLSLHLLRGCSLQWLFSIDIFGYFGAGFWLPSRWMWTWVADLARRSALSGRRAKRGDDHESC